MEQEIIFVEEQLTWTNTEKTIIYFVSAVLVTLAIICIIACLLAIKKYLKQKEKKKSKDDVERSVFLIYNVV